MGANKLNNISGSRRIYVCGHAFAVPAPSGGGKTAYKDSALDTVERRARRQKTAGMHQYAYSVAGGTASGSAEMDDDKLKKRLELPYYRCIHAVQKFFADLGTLF